jgi:hypothetical protein
VLRNSVAVMAPNTHKGYLAGLERADVPVVPTRWFARDSAAADTDAVRALPWDRIVVKPAVGGGSLAVRAFDLRGDAGVEAAAAHIAQLRSIGEVLVQPRLDSIVTEGERNIVWIDGEVSHVVTKQDRLAGDEEFVADARPATEAELQIARRALRTVPQVAQREVMYARIDVAPDALGTLRIVEFELVEPSLFLTLHEPAMQRFVGVLARECGK